MKLLVAIASTLFVVLVSQQFASAMPLDGSISFFTDMPLTERDMSDFSGMTTEKSTTEIKREVEEPLIDEATTVQVEEPVDETETKVKRAAEEFIENATTEKTKRAKAVKVIEKEELTEATEETPKKVKVTVEDKLEEVKEESTKETPKKVKVTVEDEKVEKVKEEEEHKEAEESTKEIPKKVKVTVEDEKVEKVKEEEEHNEVEESTKEIPKKPKVAVEEEKPKKFKDEKSEESKEEKSEESDFCPEGYAKFEDSCLHVGTKGKVSARSGKMSSSTPVNNLVENIPVGDDNSCPPGTEHTERGVCQKILTPEELKLKKVVDQGCPENSRLVDGRCTFHSFELTTSSMKLPLETSERMEVEPEIRREEYSTAAPEHEVIVESEFETTMQTVLKA